MNETVAKVANVVIILVFVAFLLWGIITLAEFVKLMLTPQEPAETGSECVEIDRGRPEDVQIVSQKAGIDHYQVFMTVSGEVVVLKCE